MVISNRKFAWYNSIHSYPKQKICELTCVIKHLFSIYCVPTVHIVAHRQERWLYETCYLFLLSIRQGVLALELMSKPNLVYQNILNFSPKILCRGRIFGRNWDKSLNVVVLRGFLLAIHRNLY